jgi:hypothetical protein
VQLRFRAGEQAVRSRHRAEVLCLRVGDHLARIGARRQHPTNPFVHPAMVTVTANDDGIDRILWIMNPDKLTAVA